MIDGTNGSSSPAALPRQPEAFSGVLLLFDHFSPTETVRHFRLWGPISDPRNARELARCLREHADIIDPQSPLVKPGDAGYFRPADV